MSTPNCKDYYTPHTPLVFLSICHFLWHRHILLLSCKPRSSLRMRLRKGGLKGNVIWLAWLGIDVQRRELFVLIFITHRYLLKFSISYWPYDELLNEDSADLGSGCCFLWPECCTLDSDFVCILIKNIRLILWDKGIGVQGGSYIFNRKPYGATIYCSDDQTLGDIALLWYSFGCNVSMMVW